MDNYRDDWFKLDNFWTHFQPDWAIRKYRLRNDSVERSDLIFNTCDKLIRDYDQSSWAGRALEDCLILLVGGNRWPECMDEPYDAPNHFMWRLSNLVFKLKLIKWVYYRPRNSMTRDPYYATWAAAAMRDEWDKIKLIPLPLLHFRPNGYFCWKYLVTGNKIYVKLYYFLNKLSFSKKDFVSRLEFLREAAIFCKILRESENESES